MFQFKYLICKRHMDKWRNELLVNSFSQLKITAELSIKTWQLARAAIRTKQEEKPKHKACKGRPIYFLLTILLQILPAVHEIFVLGFSSCFVLIAARASCQVFCSVHLFSPEGGGAGVVSADKYLPKQNKNQEWKKPRKNL